MTPIPKPASLTKAQIKWLQRGTPAHSTSGQIQNYDFSAFGQSNFNRMMQKLVALGLVSLYRHGGYELTETGRAALGKLS